MAQQKATIYCTNTDCKKELQVKVKYCPFCGTEYIDVKRQEEQAEQKRKEEEQQRQKAKQQEQERQADLARQKAEQENKEKQEAEAKYQAQQDAKRRALEQEAAEKAKRDTEEKQKAFAQQQADLAQEKAELERQKAQQQTNPVTPPFQPAQTKKDSSTKYVVIAFIVILIVIFLAFSGDDKPVTTQTKPQVEPDNSCETAISEINQHLQTSKPSRALTVIQMYQNDCKKNRQFIELATNAENQANTAKAKLALAKEYLQKNNLAMAEAATKNAIEIDSELIGGNELLLEIEDLKNQAQSEQENILNTNEMIESSETIETTNSNQTNQAILEQRRQQDSLEQIINQKAADEVQQRQSQEAAERLKQDNLNRQKAVEEAQRRRDEEAAYRAKQKALERQKAELAKNQNEQKYSSALVNADKALRMNNYGTAKKIAKEVLASSPNNGSALRILRQAEEGEAKAFDEMIIE